MRLAIWAFASLALAAVPEAHAAEPDNAMLLQEIKALKEAVGQLVQTVRDLQGRVTELEGRTSATTSAPPAAAANAAGAATVAPAMPAVATPVPRPALAAPPTAAGGPAPVATPGAATATLPQTAAAVPQAAPTVPQAAPLGGSTEYVSPEAFLRTNWSKIKADMDEGEVASLLGQPSKKFTLDGRNVWYYYYPGTGSGSVFFSDAGRVTSRQSPFGLWAW
jgi:hypothetical protein